MFGLDFHYKHYGKHGARRVAVAHRREDEVRV